MSHVLPPVAEQERTPADSVKSTRAVLDSLDRGRQAFAQRAWKEAYACLSAADADRPLEGRDLEMLATAAYLVGNDDGSETAWTRAYAWLRTRDKRRAARCSFWLVLQLLAIGDWARGSGWLSTAEKLLDEDAECPECGLLLALVARTHAKHGDLEAARDAFARVAALARTSDDAELKAFSLIGLAQAAGSRGDSDAAMALFDEAMVAVSSDALSPISAGVVYCAMIEACHDILDVARAREWTAALSRWCADQPDLLPFRGHCLVHRAQTLRLTGDWSSAIAHAGQACAVASEPAGQPSVSAPHDHRTRAYPIGAAFYEMAEIYRMQGQFGDAEEAYRQAHLYGRSPEPGLALLRLAQGRVDAAVAGIHRIRSQRQKRAVRVGVLAACVEIMLAADAPSEARDAADELAALVEPMPAPYLRALAAQARGAILLSEGQPRDALEALRAAWREWQALEVPYEAARARVAMGLSWRQLGDADAAELEFDAARRVFLRLAARPDVARVNDLLAPSSAAQPLTPRELQVIRLIAGGESNRAIASELAISERTVDRHVSNILTKLELSSRSAATAYAYEHGLVR
jgi:DNA-binding NarL/FixJ family response regulator